jgi:hypothetical protein
MLAEARFRHTASRLLDGTVLVAGGAPQTDPVGLGDGALASAELYLSAIGGAHAN